MAPSLPGQARSPTSKNSQWVIAQGASWLSGNKQSARFFGGSRTATDTNTKDDDDGDGDGGHLLRTKGWVWC